MKTVLFCSVFKTIYVHTYFFRIVLYPSTLQRRIRFENAVIPSVRMLKQTQRMGISYIGPQNWRKIEATR